MVMVRARASALHLQLWVCHRLGERFPFNFFWNLYPHKMDGSKHARHCNSVSVTLDPANPIFRANPPAPAKLTACHKLRRAWLSRSKKGRKGGRFSCSTVNWVGWLLLWRYAQNSGQIQVNKLISSQIWGKVGMILKLGKWCILLVSTNLKPKSEKSIPLKAWNNIDLTVESATIKWWQWWSIVIICNNSHFICTAIFILMSTSD